MTLYNKLKTYLIQNNHLNNSQIDKLTKIEKIELKLDVFLTEFSIDPKIVYEALAEILNIEFIDSIPTDYQISSFGNIEQYSKDGIMICFNSILLSSKDYLLITDINKINSLDIKKLRKKYHLALVLKKDFYHLIDKQFSRLNTQKATRALNFLNPYFASENIGYISALIKYCYMIIGFLILSRNGLVAIHYLLYTCQTMLKTSLFLNSYLLPDKKSPDHVYLTQNPEKLPIYSILVPMYQEEYGVKSILFNLKNLNYPKDKLDIKLIVEADDTKSLTILNSIELPYYIEIIKVPYSEPRTKPKALNYAMSYIKGDYVTIYDVEDSPDRDQILKVISNFEKIPDNFACIQAKLNFYNKYENLLSRLFSIEYSIWFDFLLPALDRIGVPVPLGGNSNHFKVEVIRKIGLWDAYNVTEDADLGLRLFFAGYRTKVIDSYTLEESPCEINNWLNQRSRWIKGFIQTFLIYLKQTTNNSIKQNLKTKFYMFCFIGLSTYSYFILPIHFILSNNYMPLGNQFLARFSTYMAFVFLYATSSIIIVRDTQSFKKIKIFDLLAFVLWPAYFLLHIVASYMAIFSLITSPFKWVKTTHKISREENAN